MNKVSDNYKFYQILKISDAKFYAYENGIQLNEQGELSYRSALRKYIIPKIIREVKENNMPVSLNGVSNMIDQGNIEEILSPYYYPYIIDMYGKDTKESIMMHSLIDDWNQIPSKNNNKYDEIKINPQEIYVSKNHKVTFQVLYEGIKPNTFTTYRFPNNVTIKTTDKQKSYVTHYFVNGLPVEVYQFIREKFINGLVKVEEDCVPLSNEENILDFMSEFVTDDEDYTVYDELDDKFSIGNSFSDKLYNAAKAKIRERKKVFVKERESEN